MLQDNGSFFYEVSSETSPFLAFCHFFPLFTCFLLERTSIGKQIMSILLFFVCNILMYASRLWICFGKSHQQRNHI